MSELFHVPGGNGTANPSYDPGFQVPAVAAFEFITPETARAWLDAGNRRNRDIKGAPVSRLHGVIDQGAPRSLAQTLAIDGSYADPGTTAVAVKWVYQMQNHLEKALPGQLRSTVPQELMLLAAHPDLTASLAPAGQIFGAGFRSLKKGILAAYHYAFSCADAAAAGAFFEKLAAGTGLTAGDPAQVLRDRWIADMSPKTPKNKKLRPAEAAHFLVLAWEAERAGTRMAASSLRFTRAGRYATKVATPSGVSWLGTDGSHDGQDMTEGSAAA